VYASLAEVFGEKNSPVDALNVLRRSKADFRFNPQATLQTAAAESRIYQKMGQTDKALAALATAEQLIEQLADKLSPELLVEVAKSQLKLGQKDKACRLKPFLPVRTWRSLALHWSMPHAKRSLTSTTRVSCWPGKAILSKV
jgi:hypothetical protein